MESYKPVEYPVFRRMDGNLIPGVSGLTVALALVAAAAGFLVYAALGLITVTQVQEVGFSERSELISEKEAMRDAARYLELEASLDLSRGEGALELEVLSSSTLSGLTHEEIEGLAEAAEAAGITSATTDAEIDASVPQEAPAEVPALSGYRRLVISSLPAIAVIALRYEANGVSPIRIMRKRLEYERSQKGFFYGRSGRGGQL